MIAKKLSLFYQSLHETREIKGQGAFPFLAEMSSTESTSYYY